MLTSALYKKKSHTIINVFLRLGIFSNSSLWLEQPSDIFKNSSRHLWKSHKLKVKQLRVTKKSWWLQLYSGTHFELQFDPPHNFHNTSVRGVEGTFCCSLVFYVVPWSHSVNDISTNRQKYIQVCTEQPCSSNMTNVDLSTTKSLTWLVDCSLLIF